ncbi:hypothetical protein [Neorickettsia helminthoeca]|uniref:hypothetical protein n=1 Tax=Neorickettsia helminthoeca TaxID=33994 RepID=UPI000685B48F|nr:hypothetical protein [Neorickettsia helminthoeca]
MLFYRILLFSYLIESLLALIPKLILAAAYLFISSIVLISLLNTSITVTKYAILSPGASLYYLMGYLKWLWLNKRSISLEHFIYTFIAFISPYVAWRYLKKGIRKAAQCALRLYRRRVLTKLRRRKKSIENN